MPETDLSSLHALEIKALRAYESERVGILSYGQLEANTGLGGGQIRRAVEWLVLKSPQNRVQPRWR